VRVACWPVPVVRHGIRRVIALTYDAGAE
jgi:hypothetical protein